MVKDYFNYYFTQLYNALAETYTDLQKSTVYKETPAKFPYMYFREIGDTAKIDDLSCNSVLRNKGIEVQFYAKKMTDARKLADLAKAYMIESLEFRCTFSEMVENTEDSTIFRYICRFEKIDV